VDHTPESITQISYSRLNPLSSLRHWSEDFVFQHIFRRRCLKHSTHSAVHIPAYPNTLPILTYQTLRARLLNASSRPPRTSMIQATAWFKKEIDSLRQGGPATPTAYRIYFI